MNPKSNLFKIGIRGEFKSSNVASKAQPDLNVNLNGRILNRDELISQLEMGNRQISDSVLCADVYRKWGLDCFAKLKGPFSLAIHDFAKQRLVLVRDPIGTKPLHYFVSNQTIYYSS